MKGESMSVYQVIFEEQKEGGELVEILEYVEAKDLLSVAEAMDKKAHFLEWELTCIRYALNIAEKISHH
ncbi:hypothetical protein GF380_01140 [Candidatus Uhrbacteria bacterium]|nr:hypothetical protein [Candidatus Uhrbacteria bacterium]